jgi:hypothetical protein
LAREQNLVSKTKFWDQRSFLGKGKAREQNLVFETKFWEREKREFWNQKKIVRYDIIYFVFEKIIKKISKDSTLSIRKLSKKFLFDT